MGKTEKGNASWELHTLLDVEINRLLGSESPESSLEFGMYISPTIQENQNDQKLYLFFDS